MCTLGSALETISLKVTKSRLDSCLLILVVHVVINSSAISDTGVKLPYQFVQEPIMRRSVQL